MKIGASLAEINAGGANGIIEETTQDHPPDITRAVPARPRDLIMLPGLGGIGKGSRIDGTMTTAMVTVVNLTVINMSDSVFNHKTYF
jgi:hypothetical protein